MDVNTKWELICIGVATVGGLLCIWFAPNRCEGCDERIPHGDNTCHRCTRRRYQLGVR